jgi:hypothetical protein
MTQNSQPSEDWTRHSGHPVYWLAPEFWNPKTGELRLVLDGENPATLPPPVRIQRKIEFLKLQGDPRYCTAEVSARMKRLMIERLGSDTPWRGVPPALAATTHSDEPDASAEAVYADASPPF